MRTAGSIRVVTHPAFADANNARTEGLHSFPSTVKEETFFTV
jgi:hypothetical protein